MTASGAIGRDWGVPAADGASVDAVARAVRRGLLAPRKSLPAWLLYDARGSALFEAITAQPEYYPTRTERELLARHVGEIVPLAGFPGVLAELGAGSAVKTDLVIREALAHRPRVTYAPIDVSGDALLGACRRLQRTFPALELTPIPATYERGLEHLTGLAPPAERTLLLFLGSSLGNFDRAEAVTLLQRIAAALGPRDALLLGMDLRKDPAVLLPAYDDAAGVTALFNRNVLARINRELGGTFDLSRFRHLALWNGRASRMELYLESTASQRVRIGALGLEIPFGRGERIHTENSYKPTERQLDALLRAGGLITEARWADPDRPYACSLVRAARVN